VSAPCTDLLPNTIPEVAQHFPGWYGWAGVTGIFYARWVQSTPPLVVRAASPTVSALLEAIRTGLRERAALSERLKALLWPGPPLH
jgi:hypothetical protein